MRSRTRARARPAAPAFGFRFAFSHPLLLLFISPPEPDRLLFFFIYYKFTLLFADFTYFSRWLLQVPAGEAALGLPFNPEMVGVQSIPHFASAEMIAGVAIPKAQWTREDNSRYRSPHRNTSGGVPPLERGVLPRFLQCQNEGSAATARPGRSFFFCHRRAGTR